MHQWWLSEVDPIWLLDQGYFDLVLFTKIRLQLPLLNNLKPKVELLFTHATNLELVIRQEEVRVNQIYKQGRMKTVDKSILCFGEQVLNGQSLHEKKRILVLRRCIFRQLTGLDEFDVGLKHLVVDIWPTGFHIKQQLLQSQGQLSLILRKVLGKCYEFPLHRLLEDLHIDLIIKGQQLISYLSVYHNLMEVNDPFLYLVVNCSILEKLSVVCRDQLLRSRLFTLLFERSLNLLPAWTLESISKRKSAKLLFDSTYSSKDRCHLIFDLLGAPLTVLMQIDPIVLQNVLDICQEIHQLVDNVGRLASGARQRLGLFYGMHETALGLISIAKLLLFEAVLAVEGCSLRLLVGEEEMSARGLLYLFISSKHSNYQYLDKSQIKISGVRLERCGWWQGPGMQKDIKNKIILKIYLQSMSQITPTFRATIISLMIVSGAINTIAYKFQNTQMVFEGQFYKYFFHPYMQAATMFFGESLALIIYFVMKSRDEEGFKMRLLEAKSKGKEPNFNVLWLAIPAINDLITSTLQYVALNFVSGSIYQMTRGGAIITTFIFSITFLKMKAQINQIAGSVLALVGVLIVGASTIMFSDSSDSGADTGMQIIGLILLVASLFTNGFLFVFEEKLLSKYHIEPLQMVGYEGCFGLSIQLILLIIMSFVPCSFGVDACVMNSAGMPFLENPGMYFSQAGANGFLLLFCILGIFSIATFNVTGVTVTKYINALARSICDVTRTVIVWIVGILVTVTAGVDKPNYKWQLLKGGAIALQLLGFVVLIAGNLIYNKILKIPCLMPKDTVNPLLEEEEEGTTQDKGPSMLTEP